jgi:hypothetical protein
MLETSVPDPSFETRLAKLERANRRLRWSHGVLLVLIVLACGKRTVPREIAAREFKVMDDDGRVYASLGIAPWNPEGVLTLHDSRNDGRRASIAPADLVLKADGSSIHAEAGDPSLLVMEGEGGFTGAKLSSHRESHKSALWLTHGQKSIFSGP